MPGRKPLSPNLFLFRTTCVNRPTHGSRRLPGTHWDSTATGCRTSPAAGAGEAEFDAALLVDGGDLEEQHAAPQNSPRTVGTRVRGPFGGSGPLLPDDHTVARFRRAAVTTP